MSTKKQFGPKGWTPEQLGSLAGKTYVITGANAGAGFEATRAFLSKGANVVMMNRNADKPTAAIATLKQEFGSDADVTFVRMDHETGRTPKNVGLLHVCELASLRLEEPAMQPTGAPAARNCEPYPT